LVGIGADLEVAAVEVIEEEAQPGAHLLVLHLDGAFEVLGDVAVGADGNAAVGIDLALVHVAEHQELERAVLFDRHVARQGDDLLVAEDLVFLDDRLDGQVGGAFAEVAGVAEFGVLEGAVQDHARLAALVGQGLPLHRAERAGRGERDRDEAEADEQGDPEQVGAARQDANHRWDSSEGASGVSATPYYAPNRRWRASTDWRKASGYTIPHPYRDPPGKWVNWVRNPAPDTRT